MIVCSGGNNRQSDGVVLDCEGQESNLLNTRTGFNAAQDVYRRNLGQWLADTVSNYVR